MYVVCVSVVCVLATLQFDAQTCRHLGRQTLRKLTERVREREGKIDRGKRCENYADAAQSRGGAGAGSTGCWRICISVLYTSRFYIQRKSNDKKMIYHSRPRAAFAQLTLTGRRLCAMPRLPPPSYKKQQLMCMMN